VLTAIPLAVAQRVHFAYQEGWLAHAWTIGGSVASLVAVLAAAAAGAPLPVLVLAMLAGTPLAYLANSVALYVVQRPQLRPRRRLVDREAVRRLLHAGGLFFVLSLAFAVGFQTDGFVIAHFLGSAEVAQYSVTLRLFFIAPLGAGLLLSSLWPAYTEALARGDHGFVQRTLRRSTIVVTAGAAGVSLVLVALAPWLFDRWLGAELQPPTSLLVAIGAWATVFACSTAIATFLNGATVIRFQVIVAVLMAVVNLPLSIVLVQRVGVVGPVYGSLLAQVVLVLVPELVLLWPLRRADPDGVRRWLARWSSLPHSPPL
jgi:O-antigen/teichoic acid export membrane protein